MCRPLHACCSATAGSYQLAVLLETYFHLRRRASLPASPPGKGRWSNLWPLAIRSTLNCGPMRASAARVQGPPPADYSPGSQLSNLEPGRTLTEDEVVGHSNVLFVSSTEPMAVALTWILLILSQLPELRHELRHELAAVLKSSPLPTPGMLGQLALLDRVINESLRLLPPNAFMVRITTRPTSLNGVCLPQGCEVVLCPFLAHRDSERFQRPDEFLPDRWKESPPSPYDFFPFGAGGHSCVGKNLATHVLKTVLAFLLLRYDLALAGDQDVDWQVHIMFMPRCDPAVAIHPLTGTTPRRGGKLGGPVGLLLNLNAKGAA